MTNNTNMGTMLQIEKLTKSFDKKGRAILKGVDLSIEKGKIISVVGESGSGKTTLTRLIAGLETPDQGTILLNNEMVASNTVFIPPEKRNIGMVFQDYALFPHLTVYKNVGYGISKSKNTSKRIDQVLKLVGLDGYGTRYPHQLSGGQQQRVALARAIAPMPQLLILDEPFSNLDATLKLQLRNEIFDIIKNTGVTAIFVTHDTQDAIAIADEIVVLKSGKVIQKGSAEELYKNPVDLYVASFFGGVYLLKDDDLKSFGFSKETRKKYAIRLEGFQVNNQNSFKTEALVEKSLFLGGHYFNTIKLANGSVVNCVSKQKQEGAIVLGFESDSLLVFKK